MAVYIPPKVTLPVSKGGDLIVDLQQKVNDIYTNYATGVIVRLEVDIRRPGISDSLAATVSGAGAITGYHAVCKIESEVADTITDGSLWRAVVSYPTVPQTTEIVGVNGTLKRYDGDEA